MEQAQCRGDICFEFVTGVDVYWVGGGFGVGVDV